jgi:hypothetical protein
MSQEPLTGWKHGVAAFALVLGFAVGVTMMTTAVIDMTIEAILERHNIVCKEE